MNIRQKMTVIVVTVAASFVLLITASLFLDATSEHEATEIRDHYIPQVELGYHLDADFENLSIGMRDAVSAQDPGALEGANSLRDKFVADLDTAIGFLDAKKVNRLKAAFADYFMTATETSRRLIKGETGLSIVEAMSQMQAKRAVAQSALSNVTTFDHGKLTEAFDSISRAQLRSARIRFAIGVICICFVLFVSILIMRSLILHLKDIGRGLERFGAGDFSQSIPIAGQDELALLSAEINKMAEQIQRLVREIESFSYSVAHDLRAPLRAVQGFATILSEEHSQSLSADAKALMARIVAATQRMASLVDGLLSLTRINRAAVEKKPVDLTKIARSVIEVLKAGDPNRIVVVKIAESAQAVGDPRLLDAVVSNLVGNAWKFTKKIPEAHIEFGVINEKNAVVYFIRDNGAGFDMSYSSKLFGTFQRLHSEKEFEGHGIGLATVKNIIEKHGGRIWATSKLGEGATFYFTLTKD